MLKTDLLLIKLVVNEMYSLANCFSYNGNNTIYDQLLKKRDQLMVTSSYQFPDGQFIPHFVGTPPSNCKIVVYLLEYIDEHKKVHTQQYFNFDQLLADLKKLYYKLCSASVVVEESGCFYRIRFDQLLEILN